MNERLKTLYDESVEYTRSRHIGNISQTELNHICANKFAELIVRECASLAYDGPGGILEHFGFKE